MVRFPRVYERTVFQKKGNADIQSKKMIQAIFLLFINFHMAKTQNLPLPIVLSKVTSEKATFKHVARMSTNNIMDEEVR